MNMKFRNMKMRKPFKNAPHLDAGGGYGHWFLLLICLSLTGFGISSRAQNSLNVTNYGAIGDAVQFYVNTTSNSVLVTTTNQLPLSAIGDSIEIFGAGTPVVIPPSTFPSSSNNQDMVATILGIVPGTNILGVVTETTITISQVCQQNLTNTFATYGYNNTPSFQSAIAAVGNDTNDFIYIPSGTYLLLPIGFSNPNFGHASILLQRGGINFVGAGTNSTTLLSQGAWTLINGYCVRGFLAEVAAPINNNFPDNNSPVSFSYLTMDGGVQVGNTASHGYPGSIVNGNGWDESHGAFDISGSSVGLDYICFTNVLVQHWRGEEFKSNDSPTNGHFGIYNCTFSDGNATALNIYPAWDVESNLFVNLFQVAEFYQGWSIFPGYFEYNVCTNISGNGFAINGGKGSNPSFNMLNNTFYFSNNNGIETTPGDNILIESNQFIGGAYVIALGVPGYQGTFDNSNIVITANIFTNVGTVLEIAGYAFHPNDCKGINVYNNTIYVSAIGDNTAMILNMGDMTSSSYSNNTCIVIGSTTGVHVTQNPYGQFLLINTNNNYFSFPQYAYGYSNNGTNYISYANGANFELSGSVKSNLAFALVDTNASQMPAGAIIQFYNNNSSSASVPVYLGSSLQGSPVTVANGQTATFYWQNWANAWSTNSQPPPPTYFRPNY
jgi:hypothetical protein